MGLKRRHFLYGAAGLGAAAAVPVGLHLRWSGKDFTRPGYSEDWIEPPEGEDVWRNWSGNRECTPKAILFPAAEEELAQQIAETQLRVRPIGSGHSFSALCPGEGLLVDVSHFSGMSAYDESTGVATFGAGTRLFQAAAELAEMGRAFANLSDIDVQTLAGAYSTATHGTGLSLPALHDDVVGFRIVLADGSIRDVSQGSDPALFAAGLVSLGALGVITQYRVRTVPAFNLHRRVWIAPWQEIVEQAEALAAAHRNFEFFTVPSTGYALALTHDVHDGPADEGFVESEDEETLAALRELRDALGWWPWLRRKVAQSAFPTGEIENRRAASHELLATTRPDLFNEMEYHLPTNVGPETLREVAARLDAKKEAFFPIEFRYTAGDTAWLSPFQGGARCSIAIHAAADERYDYFFEDFEPMYLERGGRPHWGKLNRLTTAQASALYPDFDKFAALRGQLDPAGKFLNPHLAGLFGEDFSDGV